MQSFNVRKFKVSKFSIKGRTTPLAAGAVCLTLYSALFSGCQRANSSYTPAASHSQTGQITNRWTDMSDDDLTKEMASSISSVMPCKASDLILIPATDTRTPLSYDDLSVQRLNVMMTKPSQDCSWEIVQNSDAFRFESGSAVGFGNGQVVFRAKEPNLSSQVLKSTFSFRRMSLSGLKESEKPLRNFTASIKAYDPLLPCVANTSMPNLNFGNQAAQNAKLDLQLSGTSCNWRISLKYSKSGGWIQKLPYLLGENGDLSAIRGSIPFELSANTGAGASDRQATISILSGNKEKLAFHVRQNGRAAQCVATPISPLTTTYAQNASSGTIGVNLQGEDCGWHATTAAGSFLQGLPIPLSSGMENIRFTLESNTGTESRKTQITVQDRSGKQNLVFSIVQVTTSPCSVVVRDAYPTAYGAETQQPRVFVDLAGSGCQWNVRTDSDSWIQRLPYTLSEGSGQTISFYLPANKSYQRTGRIRIYNAAVNGRTSSAVIEVTQLSAMGKKPCMAASESPNLIFNRSDVQAGTAAIRLSGDNCDWKVSTSRADWITNLPPSLSGSESRLGFLVTKNRSSLTRYATITIKGSSSEPLVYTIQQN